MFKKTILITSLLVSPVCHADEVDELLSQVPFDWNYGEATRNLDALKSPYPVGSAADKLWKTKIKESINKNKDKLDSSPPEDTAEDEKPLYRDGNISQPVEEHKGRALTPLQKINQFSGALGFMAAGMKVCRPEEVKYIEACGNIILNHWKYYSGDDVMPNEKDKRDQFKAIIGATYKDALEKGNKEALQASKQECENMYKAEQLSLIWKSCGRHLENTESEQPVINN